MCVDVSEDEGNGWEITTAGGGARLENMEEIKERGLGLYWYGCGLLMAVKGHNFSVSSIKEPTKKVGQHYCLIIDQHFTSIPL